jgi:nucleoside-diphosphate-sugar epimerase
MSERIGVIGASGFAGSALCERLHAEGRTFVACVRNPGNAGRVARLGVPIRVVDLLDPEQVAQAVNACDVIVNCALGNDAAMYRGLKNLLAAVRRQRPARFIHLSSLAIYGEDPAPESASEAGRPDPGRNPYGIAKLRQDELVLELGGSGVPVYILCPGIITGPYSPFARGMAERLERGPLPLIDGGRYASNLVHVDNLVEAVLAAIRSDTGAGERYFVNETRPVSWRTVWEDLARRLGRTVAFVDASREEVLPLLASFERRAGIKDHVRIALSAEFRRAMSLLPAFGWIHRGAASLFESLPPATQQKIRERVRWPVRVEKPSGRPPLDDRYVKVQVRRYYHSPEKLARQLGWQPPLSYEQGLDTLVSWLRFAGICEAVPG